MSEGTSMQEKVTARGAADALGAADATTEAVRLELEDAEAGLRPDATTSATWSQSAGDDVDAVTGATCVGDRAESGRGSAVCVADGSSSSFDDEVQEVIDAVTGATWGTRNQIMEDMFHRKLDRDASSVPTFAPPGEVL